MLVLTDATDELELWVADATVVPMHGVLFYRDIDSASYLPGRNAINPAGPVTATLLQGSATYKRVVDFVSVANPNAAQNATVRIRFVVGATTFDIVPGVVLGPLERLEYQDGKGWSVYTSTGALKTSLNQGANAASSGESLAVLAADVTNNNAVANSIADVTGLSFPVVANTRYAFDFFILYTAAATTTGSRWTITGPAFNLLSYESEYALTTVSQTVNDGLGAYDLPAACNASSAATTQNTAQIKGMVRPTVDGVIIARFASEIASSAIVAKAGSFVKYQAI